MKWVKYMCRQFSKDEIQMSDRHIEITNKNHKEIPPFPVENGYHAEVRK